MWLHGATFNTARERAGRRRVSALWMWNAEFPQIVPVRAAVRSDVVCYGRDPMIEALMREAGENARDAPGHWAQIDMQVPHVVVEFAALTGGSHETLEALDTNWFAPVRTALMNGNLREFAVIANDRRFRIGARSRHRFWRRHRPWLARLGT